MIDTHARKVARSRTRNGTRSPRDRASASLSPSATEPLLDGAAFSPPSTTDFADVSSSHEHSNTATTARPNTAGRNKRRSENDAGGGGGNAGYLTLGNVANHRFLSEDSGRLMAQSPKDSTVFTEFSSFSESTFLLSDNAAPPGGRGAGGDNSSDVSRRRRLSNSFYQSSSATAAGCSTDLKKQHHHQHSLSDMAEPMLRGVESS